MKRSFFPVLVAVLVLCGVLSFAAWIFFHHDRHPQLQLVEIPQSYLETTDTSMYSVQPVLLERTSPDDSLLVLFPVSQKGHEIFVYDSAGYDRLLFGDRKAIPFYLPSTEGLSAVYGRPVLNFTGLKKGKYYIHVTDCNFAGFFEIDIEENRDKGGK